MLHYDAYGTPTFHTSALTVRSPNSSVYSFDSLFSGRQYDPEASFYYYRNRAYVEELGRFSARDPISSLDEVNVYAYVADAPPNLVDPSGTRWIIAGTVSSVCFITQRWTSTKPHRKYKLGKLCDLTCECPAGSTMILGEFYNKSKVPCDRWPPAPLCYTWKWVEDPAPNPVCEVNVKVTYERFGVLITVVIAIALLAAFLAHPPLGATIIAVVIVGSGE